MFLAYLYSAGTQHGNLHPNRVTYFILRAYTGTKNSEEVLEKMQVWTGRVEISKEESLAVSVACMAIY